MPLLLRVHAGLFLVTLIYSTNFVIAKFITPAYILPFGIILMRVFGSAALFTFLHALTVREKVKDPRDYWAFAYCAIFGVVLNQLLFFKGLSITNAINISIIMTSSPILVLIVSSLVLKEKITVLKMLGIALGLTGAILLIGGRGLSFSSETVVGDLLILGNATSYGIYLVMVKPLMRKYESLTVVKWIFLFGCIGVFPFGIGEFMIIDWEALPAYAIWILVFIVVGVTFMAYLINAWGLRYVNASVVAFYIYLQPVLTSMIAISLGQDQLTLSKVIYSCLILLGVYLVSKPRKQPAV